MGLGRATGGRRIPGLSIRTSTSHRTGPPATSARIGPPMPASVGAGCQRVDQGEDERAEARVVQAAPATLADPSPHPERHGQRQHQPAGDDAGGDSRRPERRGERHEHGGRAEMHDRVEKQGSHVEPDHREARPCERPMPAEEPRLEPRPQKPRAHAEPEPRREREDAEGDEPGRAGDEPCDGESGGRAHDATSRAHAGTPSRKVSGDERRAGRGHDERRDVRPCARRSATTRRPG